MAVWLKGTVVESYKLRLMSRNLANAATARGGPSRKRASSACPGTEGRVFMIEAQYQTALQYRQTASAVEGSGPA